MTFLSLVVSFEAAQAGFDLNRSVRAMGMGNAFTAVVDDVDSLMYNPAGLARIGGLNLRVVDLRIGTRNIDDYENFTDVLDSDDLLQSVNDLIGERVWVGGGAKTAIGFPYFAFGVYDSFDIGLEFNNPAYPTLDASAVNDINYVVGFAFPVIPHILYGGLNIKRIDRMGSEQSFGADDLNDLDSDSLQDELLNSGTGYGLDLGFNFVLPSPIISPIVSVVWQDFGGTSFRGDGTLPPSKQENLTVGASAEVDALIISVTPSLEFTDITNSDIDFGQKINVGVEVSLPLIDVRAGFHQGYYTLGAGMNFGPFELDVASYGVELGAYPGQREDRRYMLELKIDLSLGSSFSLFDDDGADGSRSGGNRRRRLKQRR